jgi:hypothetical protein
MPRLARSFNDSLAESRTVSRSSRGDPRSLSELFGSGNLGSLAAEARRRSALAARVRVELPEEEAAHLVSAGTGPDGELVLVMDSAVWAARVRFSAEKLGVKRLRVKVAPPGR